MAAALHEQFASLENGCEAELEVGCLSSAVLMAEAMHCALCSILTLLSRQSPTVHAEKSAGVLTESSVT